MEIPTLTSGNPTVTYNSATNKSTFAKPSGLNGVGKIAAYDIDDLTTALKIGNYAEVTVNGSNLEITEIGQTRFLYRLFIYYICIIIYYVTRTGKTLELIQELML